METGGREEVVVTSYFHAANVEPVTGCYSILFLGSDWARSGSIGKILNCCKFAKGSV